MINVGITGQHGFVGWHLYNTLALSKDEFELVNFERAYFDDTEKLDAFVSSCDVIVHLAAMNRHPDLTVLFDTNVSTVEKLVDSLERTKSKAHVLFSSSTQEERDNPYGKSKLIGREKLAEWAHKNQAQFTGLVIPNVFGPFGLPYYNSVVATFCHQLTHNETSMIDVDGVVKLIYVQELVAEITSHIIQAQEKTSFSSQVYISPRYEVSVSEILAKLVTFQQAYFLSGTIPSLESALDKNLFNTFRSFINHKEYFPQKLIKHTDERGAFTEVIRLQVGGQVSFSTTKPNITRGNHFHTRKIERFTVIKGKALIQLRKIGSDEQLDFYLDGSEPAYVDMPIWYTHNIKNIGEEELYTIFWINEFYDSNDPDTYFETV